MLTRRQLIIAKLEYLNGGPIPEKKLNKLLSKIRVGDKQEFKKLMTNAKNKFVSIEDVVLSKKITNETSKDELQEILKEISIKATSVESGLKMLKKAQNHSKNKLLRYIYNLCMKDAFNHNKIKKRGWDSEPILQREPLLTPGHTDDLAWSYLSFYNPAQENNPTKPVEYDAQNQYLKNEEKLDTHPSHTEPKKPTDKRKKLRRYIHKLIINPSQEEPGSGYGKS